MIVIGYDATHANISRLPKGAQAAGYTTGSPDIQWTSHDWASHPGAVRIDQDWKAGDARADVLDVENGAATPAECPAWVKAATASFTAALRPGQRRPAIYCSASSVTTVVNSLVAGGIRGGMSRLVVADWNLTQAQATAAVTAASGPFPVVGIQFRDPGPYDVDVYSAQWLNDVSVTPPPPGPVRHVADGKTTLVGAAVSAGRTVLEVAVASVEETSTVNRRLFVRYLVDEGPHVVMPHGLVWWS